MNEVKDYDLYVSVYRGTNHTVSMDIKDDDNNAYDLTDCDVLLTLTNPYLDTPALEKQGYITDAVAGSVDFRLLPADTEDLVAIGYDFSVWVINNAHEVTTYHQALRGRFGIKSSLVQGDEE